MSKITSHVSDSVSASSAPSFGVIQPDSGTSPSADQANDTLTVSGQSGILTTIGDATTDTLLIGPGANFNEYIQDIVGNSFIVAGAGLTATYTDPSNFLTMSLDQAFASSLILSSGSSLFVRRPGDYMHGQLGFTTSTGLSACIYAHSNQDGQTNDLEIIRFGQTINGSAPGVINWSNQGEGNNAVEIKTSTSSSYLNFFCNSITAAGILNVSGSASIGTTTAMGNAFKVTRDGLSTTSQLGGALQNTTAAVSATAVQYSPALDFIGHGLLSLGSVDRTARFRIENRPVSGNPDAVLTFLSSVDTGTSSYTERMSINSLGFLVVQNARITAITPSHVMFAGSTGQITGDSDFIFNGQGLLLATTGISGGVMMGGDAQWYRSAADEMRTPDGLVVDGRAAIGTAIATTTRLLAVETVSTNVSAVAVDAQATIATTISGAFPRALRGTVSVNGSTNTISYVAGVVGSVRTETGQTGAISEQYGFDFDCWHRGAANIGTMSAARAFVSVRNTSAGTITSLFGYRASLDTQSGGTNSAIGTAIGFEYAPTYAGNAVMTTSIGVRVQNPTGGGTASGTNYGIRIGDQSFGTVNYALSFDGTSGLERQGIWWNADTVLHRSAADEVKTPDTFFAGGGLKLNRVSGATTQTLGTTHIVVGVDTTATRTITLPTATSQPSRTYWIGDQTGTANTNPITIGRSGSSDLISGSTLITINTSRGWVCLNSNGSFFWDVISNV